MLGRGGTRHSCRASSRRFTYSCEPLHRVNEKCGQSAGARPYCIPGDRVHRAPLVTVAPQGKRNVHERRARARWRIKCSFYRGEFQRDALKSKIHRFSVFFLSVFSLSFFLFSLFLSFFFSSFSSLLRKDQREYTAQIIITSFSFVVVFPFLSSWMGMRILFDISYNILDWYL